MGLLLMIIGLLNLFTFYRMSLLAEALFQIYKYPKPKQIIINMVIGIVAIFTTALLVIPFYEQCLRTLSH